MWWNGLPDLLALDLACSGLTFDHDGGEETAHLLPRLAEGYSRAFRVWAMRSEEAALDPQALRAARVRVGLTQHELARLIGVAGGERVSRWELGTSAPRTSVLPRLATALGVPPGDLLAPNSDEHGLRRMRVLAGLTPRQLADLVHVSVANVQRWEAGRAKRTPSVKVLEQLASAMGSNVGDVQRAFARSRGMGEHWE